MTTPAELGLDTPGLNDLIRDGAGNITTNAEVLAQAYDELGAYAQAHAGARLPSGSNLDTILTPSMRIAAPTLDTIENTPPDAITGFVHTWINPAAPTTSRYQVYYELNTGGRIWTRFRGSGSWTPWERLGDPSRVDTPRPAVGTNLDNEAADGRGRAILVFPGIDSITNAPEDANGVCRTWVNRTAPTVSRLQVFYEFNTGRRIWSRFRGSGGWTAWERVDAAYAIEQAAEGGENGTGTPSALKTLPLILTASTSAAPETVAVGSVRFPFNVNAPITRWRLHVRNHNDYTNTTYTGGAAFTGLWVGPRSGNSAGFSSAPVQALPAFTLPAGGGEYVSAWVSDVPLGDGVERLLSLGWTGATGQNAKSAAGAYRSTNSTTAGAASAAGYVLGSDAPFSWWLEVETTATTPVVAIWGDSISAGTGNTLPIHDSPLAQYCRRIGGLPYHAALPGSMMLSWEPTGATHPTWERWAGLSRPDAVIHFMGQNDLLNAGTLAEMQRRFEATLPLVGKHLSQNIYVATITPSSSKTEAQHAVRRAYNTWLKTRPFGVRDAFDFAAAVGNATDDALRPEYATDTTHLNTAGSAALAAAITRPVTTQRTDSDTGWRNMPTANASTIRTGAGTLQVRRIGSRVTWRFNDLALTDGSGAGVLMHASEWSNGFTPYAHGPIFHLSHEVGSSFLSKLKVASSLFWIGLDTGTALSLSRSGVALQGEFSYLTDDPWPVTLPGTPA